MTDTYFDLTIYVYLWKYICFIKSTLSKSSHITFSHLKLLKVFGTLALINVIKKLLI